MILIKTPVEYFQEDGIWKPGYAPQPFGIEGHQRLATKEFYIALEFCLGKLSALWNSIFKMKHLDEQNADTICETMRITSSNYWVIIHRAKLNLRNCLQKKWILRSLTHLC